MGDCRVVSLWNGRKGPLPFGVARLEIFAPETAHAAANPVIVVVPGGGYGIVAPNEGIPVARVINSWGFHAAVLNYRIAPQAYPAALADLARAVRLLRVRGQEFGIDRARIGVLGFSAGGHLAGLISFAPDHPVDHDDDLAATVSARPDRVALVYPLVRISGQTHAESARNFFGPTTSEVGPRFDLDQLIGPDAPPFLVTHAEDDDVVPVIGPQTLVARARALGIEARDNILPTAGHGFVLQQIGEAAWPQPLRHWFDALRA
jgi:acetyl esterase/lipase